MKKTLPRLICLLLAAAPNLPWCPAQIHAAVEAPTETAKDVPAPIQPGETLTLERVIAITRANHPEILAARGSIKRSQSQVGQTESQYYPQINGNAGYNRLSPSGTIYGTSDDSSYNQLEAGISGSQLLYDFGKTRTKVEISRTNLEATQAELSAADNNAISNATRAYYNLLKITRNREVATETVKQFEQHLEQAKGFFASGVKPKYDVTKAEVDLSRARLTQIQVENNLRLARVELNNAMGLPNSPDYALTDTLDAAEFNLSYTQALSMAATCRSDLKSLMLKKKAAEQGVELARKGDLPTLSGSARAGVDGDVETMDEGWSAGVALSIPIFNGHLTRHRIDEAQAETEILSANITAQEQNIHKEIEQGYLNLHEAQERISTTQLAIEQAMENARIASGRYTAGVGSPVEVTDANILLVEARAEHNEALYDYRIAQTSIEHATGMIEGPCNQENRQNIPSPPPLP